MLDAPTDPETRAAGLRIWRGPVTPVPLGGGFSNTNFLVDDRGDRYVVRVGDDLPVHGVLRRNELAASVAAHAAGLSPAVVHHEPGVLVLRYVEGSRPLTAEEVRQPELLPRLAALLRRCHHELPLRLRGPALMFWVFHAVRDYAATLQEGRSPHLARLPTLLDRAAALERAVGPIEVVFGHNDLLPANILDDGARLWLIDWEYAGFNSPLFDLGGLASNAELDEAGERRLLTAYYGRPPDPDLLARYAAMKCASLLRETLWSMASELHSRLAFDYAAYTAENLARFERAWAALPRSP